MASIEEVWGSSFESRKPMTKAPAEPQRDAAKEGRVYRTPQERTQASVFTHKKSIDDLSKTLPIVKSDEEAGRNYRPERSRVRESFGTTEYAYAPPSFQPPPQEDKLSRILHMIEQNRTGYQPSSTQDMLLYIATGVFFLFAMDTFVSLGKRMK